MLQSHWVEFIPQPGPDSPLMKPHLNSLESEYYLNVHQIANTNCLLVNRITLLEGGSFFSVLFFPVT